MAADKKLAQKQFERKLLLQEEELNQREKTLHNSEQRLALLSAHAEDVKRREEQLGAREERCAALEFELEETLKVADNARIIEMALEEQRQDLTERTKALEQRIDEFRRDSYAREEELGQRLSEVSIKEQRASLLKEEVARMEDAASKSLNTRSQELQTNERELKIRQVQVTEEHSSLQQWSMTLRTKEEEHDQYLKLFKEMEAVDERSRRQIKWQEDDLEKRRAEFQIQKEDHLAKVAESAALRESLEEERRRIDVKRKEIEAEGLSLQRKVVHHNQQVELFHDREASFSEEERHIREERGKLDAEKEQLAREQVAFRTAQREAEIDLKRVSQLRMRTTEQEKKNSVLQKKLAQREKELTSWDGELDWREEQFSRSVEAAMNVPLTADPSPAYHNTALVKAQTSRMLEHYGAAQKRRVLSAMQPHNRAKSAQPRTCSPPRRAQSASAGANRSRAAADAEELTELFSESHKLELQRKVSSLEKDFRFFTGKVLLFEHSAATNEDREKLLSTYFSPHERVTISLALAREREVGEDLCFRQLANRCPLRLEIGGGPADVVQAVHRWWNEVERHFRHRDEGVLRERLELLTAAVDILRRTAPKISSSGLSRMSNSSRPPRPATAGM